jgi:hypothetical protein
MQSVPGVYKNQSRVLVVRQQSAGNDGSRKIFIVGSSYLAMSSEDIYDFISAVVTAIFEGCKLVRLL